MRRGPRRTPQVITLTTDFGTEDSYVAQMKGVLLQLAPAAQIVDVTHAIGPQDVLAGSIALEQAVRAFGPGTIHVAVVDPGVGSERRLLLVRLNDQTIICPDNGLITWTWRRQPGAKAFEMIWRPERPSATFHGRDIMAPVAGRMAAGEAWRKFCRPTASVELLEVAPAASLAEARVIHVDHFGNAMTNVPAELVEGNVTAARVRRHRVLLKRTYADVAMGQAVALVGSSGLLEIAVRNGSAAKTLRLRVGDRVELV